jgi:hypothetical protein
MSIGMDLGWFSFGFEMGKISVLNCGPVRIWISRISPFEEVMAHHGRVAAIQADLLLLYRQEAAARIRKAAAAPVMEDAQ